jgi:hypothetical protein
MKSELYRQIAQLKEGATGIGFFETTKHKP